MDHACSKCEKNFSTKLLLTIHTMERHEFDLESNSMTNNISIAAALNIKDVKVVEEKIIERNFECQECGKKLKSQRVVDQHFRQFHQPWTHNQFCHLCSYSTFERARLTKHMGEKHNMGQFKCTHCPHISTSPAEAGRHRVTHVGRKRDHYCPQCDFAADGKKIMAKHMWTEHSIVFKYNKNSKK